MLGDVISSLEGLDRGDLEIGDPSEEEFDIDDIPDDATDVFRVTPRKLMGLHIKGYRLNQKILCENHDIKIKFYLPSLDTGIIENGPDGFVL